MKVSRNKENEIVNILLFLLKNPNLWQQKKL